jgi:hypothetical protein
MSLPVRETIDLPAKRSADELQVGLSMFRTYGFPSPRSVLPERRAKSKMINRTVEERT